MNNQVGELAAWIGYLAGEWFKVKTTKASLAGLRLLCPEFKLDETKLKVYSHSILQRVIEVFRRIYGEGDNRKRQPITGNILLQLISRLDQITLQGFNLHAAFCSAFAVFLLMGKFTCNKGKSNFSSWNLTRGFGSLSEDRLFLVIPSCKTDTFHRGITLTISAANDEAYVVTSLKNLFTRFAKANSHPLFTNHVGTFSRYYVTRKPQEGIRVLGYEGNHTGHSFRRGAATSAKLAGLSDHEIQLLRRWKSNFYCHYV